jgi:hypothetical protein
MEGERKGRRKKSVAAGDLWERDCGREDEGRAGSHLAIHF